MNNLSLRRLLHLCVVVHRGFWATDFRVSKKNCFIITAIALRGGVTWSAWNTRRLHRWCGWMSAITKKTSDGFVGDRRCTLAPWPSGGVRFTATKTELLPLELQSSASTLIWDLSAGKTTNDTFCSSERWIQIKIFCLLIFLKFCLLLVLYFVINGVSTVSAVTQETG